MCISSVHLHNTTFVPVDGTYTYMVHDTGGLFVCMWICFCINRLGTPRVVAESLHSPFLTVFFCLYSNSADISVCFHSLKGVRPKHAEAKAAIKC